MARVKLLALLGVVLLLGLASRVAPLGAWTQGLTTWVHGAGWLGVAVFAAIYVAATVLGLPALPLTLAAGWIYGPVRGTLLVSPASVLGASLAFLLGRTLLRDRVRARIEGRGRFQALDRAIGREGWRLVALLRLSPVFPFSLLNYALGLTDIPLGDYVLASWLAMLPATVLYVSAGAAAGVATGATSTPGLPAWLLGLGLAATLAVTLRVTHIARISSG